MNAVDTRCEFEKIAHRVGWQVVVQAKWGESSVKLSDNLARAVGMVAAVKNVQRGCLLKSG